MTISPIQPLRDYVTKKEFNDFKSYIEEGFDITNKHIDNLETHMNGKFAEVKEDITGLKKTVDRIDERLDMQKEDIGNLTKVVNKIEIQLFDQKESLLSLNKVVNKIAAKIL